MKKRMVLTWGLIPVMILIGCGCGAKKEIETEKQESDIAVYIEETAQQPVETAAVEPVMGIGSAKQPPEDASEESAGAEEVYHAVRDETGILWSEELERLSTDILPGLALKYGIDMRVDILTDSGDFEELAETAAFLYQEYGYGSPDGRNGVTLTLLVHEDETGVALDAWHPYAAGESWELTTNGTWNICQGSDTWLSGEAWEGDCRKDAEMLVGAVNDMAVGLEKFVLAGGVGSTIWSPLTESFVEQSGVEQ